MLLYGDWCAPYIYDSDGICTGMLVWVKFMVMLRNYLTYKFHKMCVDLLIYLFVEKVKSVRTEKKWNFIFWVVHVGVSL